MKRMWWIIILLILAAGLFAALFLGRSADDPSTHGGVREDKTDPNAPKVIHSTEIISFDCAFSTSARLETGSLNRGHYILEASLENGTVAGSYYSAANAQGNPENASFEADAFFMADLHSIVAQYDLAKYNGLSYRVSGLPSHLGGSLTVAYASGEQISARNNQTNFFTTEEMEALEALFRKAAFGENKTEDSEGG